MGDLPVHVNDCTIQGLKMDGPKFRTSAAGRTEAENCRYNGAGE
jgi:hypothetical protein